MEDKRMCDFCGHIEGSKSKHGHLYFTRKGKKLGEKWKYVVKKRAKSYLEGEK